MSTQLALYDRARAAIATRGFDSDTQTKIALFLGATKSVNAAILAAAELQPLVTVVYPFIHGQYFRELEFVTLLARVTRWSANSGLYGEGAALIAPLWNEWWRTQFDLGTVPDGSAPYAALALGHALLARVRLTPVIADGVDQFDPFVIAVQRIERENGRMIQAQIRLLKDAPSPLGIERRERLIGEKQTTVDAAFEGFLEWLGNA